VDRFRDRDNAEGTRELVARRGHPLGAAVDVFIRREDADRFIEDVRRDEPELAARLRIEPTELDAGHRN
jgi:hypothetical protein